MEAAVTATLALCSLLSAPLPLRACFKALFCLLTIQAWMPAKQLLVKLNHVKAWTKSQSDHGPSLFERLHTTQVVKSHLSLPVVCGSTCPTGHPPTLSPWPWAAALHLQGRGPPSMGPLLLSADLPVTYPRRLTKVCKNVPHTSVINGSSLPPPLRRSAQWLLSLGLAINLPSFSQVSELFQLLIAPSAFLHPFLHSKLS